MLRLQSPQGMRAGGVRATNTHRRNTVAFINGPIFEDGVFVMVPVSSLVSAARGVKVFARSRHRDKWE